MEKLKPSRSHARKPVQARSQARFEAILDAAHQLLADRLAEDISIYDLADATNIPPASVYHLFPTIEAVYSELGKRYLQDLTHLLDVEPPAEVKSSWQSLLRYLFQRGQIYYNQNPAAMQILLCPTVSHEILVADIQLNDKLGAQAFAILDRCFILPPVPGLAEKISLSIRASDAIWSRACTLYGHIPDEDFAESMTIVLAYLRTVLPESLFARQP